MPTCEDSCGQTPGNHPPLAIDASLRKVKMKQYGPLWKKTNIRWRQTICIIVVTCIIQNFTGGDWARPRLESGADGAEDASVEEVGRAVGTHRGGAARAPPAAGPGPRADTPVSPGRDVWPRPAGARHADILCSARRHN